MSEKSPEEVQDRSFKGVVDAIDPATLAQTVNKVANAVNVSIMLNVSQKAQAEKIIITHDTTQSKDWKYAYRGETTPCLIPVHTIP